MSSALLVGDVHLKDKSPSGRTETYTRDILDKLQWAVDFANSQGLPVVQAGDLFDVKRANHNSYGLVQRTHDVLRQADKGVWIVPGNHDLQHDRLESLDSQPLGALCRMENVNLLLGEATGLDSIYGIPYLPEFDGGDWRSAVDWWNTDSIEHDTLIVTHAPLFPPGQEPGVYASIRPHDWAELFIGCMYTYYGHIHECHGTYTANNMTFCNQGALSRGSLHEATITRKPAVTVWNGSTFERIEVPHKPAEEVFKLADAAITKENKKLSDAFSTALGSVQLEAVTVEQVLAHVRASGVGHEVVTLVEELVADALDSDA